MTQYELVIAYIKEFGSIVPAKIGGTPYLDGFFGSETSKRCRELRKKGKLTSEPDGKFERFKLAEYKPTFRVLTPEEVAKQYQTLNL